MFYLLPYVHVFSYLPTFILKEVCGGIFVILSCEGGKQKKEIQMNEFPFFEEVSSGVEPLYTVLQTVT